MMMFVKLLLKLIIVQCFAMRPASAVRPAVNGAYKDLVVQIAVNHDGVLTSADSPECNALLLNDGAAIENSLRKTWESRGGHRYFSAADHAGLPEKTMIVHLSAQEGKTFKRCECAKKYPQPWAAWSKAMLTYLHDRVGQAELVAGDFNCDFVKLPGFESIFSGWDRFPSPSAGVHFTSSKKRSWLQTQLHKADEVDEGIKDVALWKSGGAFKNAQVEAWYKGSMPASPRFPNDVLPSDHMPLVVTYGAGSAGLFVVWNVLGGAKPNEFEFPQLAPCWRPAQDWYNTHYPLMGPKTQKMSPNLAWIDSCRGIANREHSLQKMFQRGHAAFRSTEHFVSWDEWVAGTNGALDAYWYKADKISMSEDWKTDWGDSEWFWTGQVEDPFTEQWKTKCDIFEEQKDFFLAALAGTGFMARVAMWLYLFDCVSFTLVQDAVSGGGCTSANIAWYGSLVANKNADVQTVIETIRNDNAGATQVHVALVDGAEQLSLDIGGIAGLAKLD